MNLRTKSLLLLGLTLVGAISVIFLLSSTILLGNFTAFDQRNILDDLNRAEKVISDDEGQLELLIRDYARWDESYSYVLGNNSAFVSQNLNREAIANLNIDLFILFDINRSIVFETEYDAAADTLAPTPPVVLQEIAGTPSIWNHTSLNSVRSGILNTSEGLMLVSSEPVITSAYTGPSVGTMVMGRKLTSKRIHQMNEVSGLNLSLIPDPSGQSTLAPVIQADSEDQISCHTHIPDISGNRSVLLSVFSGRTFYRQGQSTIISYSLLLLLVGSVLVAVSLLIIDTFVLKKINLLITFIKRREGGAPVDPLLQGGKDEFRDLLHEIIPVFDTLSQSEQELRRSEERYRNVVETQTEFICRFTPDGAFLFVNPAYCNYFKRSPDAHVWSDAHIHPDDRARLQEHYRTLTPDHPVATIEHRIIRDGDVRWVQWTDLAIFDSNGRITEYQSVGRDITEKRSAEEEIEKLASIVHTTRTGIVTGTGTRIDVVNPAFFQMHGRLPGELDEQTLLDLVCPNFHLSFPADLARAEKTGHYVFESEHTKKDGTLFPTLNDLTVITDPDKGTRFWILNVQDISEHRIVWKLLMESEALRESSRQLREVISLLPDATFVLDKDGWVIIWNKAMEKMTGIAADDIIGRGQQEYSIPFYGEKRPMLIDIILDPSLDPSLFPDLRRDGDSLSVEVHLTNDRVGDVYYSSVATPLYDARKNRIGAIESIRDITPTKMAEKSLIRMNEKLHLLSSITRHDIRNRLTVLRSLIPIMIEEYADPEIREYLDLIDRATIAIADQIEFTHDYQEMGIYSPEWWDAGKLVEKVRETGIADHISITNHLSGIMVYADPLLERVFYNLIDNAVRHGGSVTEVSFSYEESEGSLYIQCEDNGRGVPASYKEKIFERGFGSNTGLGLFLVTEILSITGMSIIENGISGARFIITVPHGAYRTVL